MTERKQQYRWAARGFVAPGALLVAVLLYLPLLWTLFLSFTDYNGLGGYVPKSAKSEGGYVLGAYIFPKAVGIGKFEILGKFAKAESFDQKLHVVQKTTEVNLNYLIKQFNARIMTFYDDTRFNKTSLVPNFWQIGIGLQVQI